MVKRLTLATRWGDLSIVGGARAGEGTLILLPQMKLALDAGRAHRALTPASTVCISHGHADHLGGLAYWASQRQLSSMAQATLFAPREISGDIEDLLELHARLEGGKTYDVRVVPVSAGERHDFRRDMRLEFFPTDHWVPTLGSRLIWTRRSLRPDLAGSSPEDLARLRSLGEQITTEVSHPLLVYGADAGVGLLDQPEKLAADVIILECSFLADKDIDRARRFSHLHAADIVKAAPHLRCRHLVLVHLSRRHRIREIEAVMRSEIAPLVDADLHHLVIDWE